MKQLSSRRRVSNRRLVMAFAVAALADGLSVVWTLAPPVQWMADAATAISLFVLLGWQWVLLPGLVMEAIPGLYVFPFWVLVVGAMAMWGSARSNWPDGLNPDERSRNHWRMDK